MINYKITPSGDKYYFKYEWTIKLFTEFIKENKIDHTKELTEEDNKKWGDIYSNGYQKQKMRCECGCNKILSYHTILLHKKK